MIIRLMEFIRKLVPQYNPAHIKMTTTFTPILSKETLHKILYGLVMAKLRK